MKKLTLFSGILVAILAMMACTCSHSHKPVKCPSCKTVIEIDSTVFEDDGPTALPGRNFDSGGNQISFDEAHVKFSGLFRQINDTTAQRFVDRTIFIKAMARSGRYRYYMVSQ